LTFLVSSPAEYQGQIIPEIESQGKFATEPTILPSSRSIAVLVLLFKPTQKSVSIPGTQVRLWDARRELDHPFCNFVGSVCSPLLANIFLHEVLDAWYERDVKPRMKGRTFLLRFADDFVIGCEREENARRIMAVLQKRVAHFGLTIHPTKTVLVSFRKRASRQETDTGNGTFELLGLTHDWARSRRGYWVIKGETAGKRLWRAQKSLWQ